MVAETSGSPGLSEECLDEFGELFSTLQGKTWQSRVKRKSRGWESRK
jgi:hypothetical protein